MSKPGVSHTGNLRKMRGEATDPVSYQLPLNETLVPLNPFIGQEICLEFTGKINCIHCNRVIKKSYQQGYCYPCMMRLAECDFCIIHPERCHHDKGTCRDDDWAHAVCMKPHVVYIANTSGLKVGITRQSHVPTRWIDQGAIQALPIFQVSNRFQSGVLEVAFKQFVNDKTQWRKMLNSPGEPMDMFAERDALIERAEKILRPAIEQFPEGDIFPLTDATEFTFKYPVNTYPEKVSSLSFDKTPKIQSVLNGIKGQYLIFDSGVINIRKFAGYHINLYGDL